LPRAASIESQGEPRERILGAALEIFSQQGFEGAKTRDIAARADVTLGLLQYYFGSKPKLWEAAVDLAFAEMSKALDNVLDDPDLVDDAERMRALLRGYVYFVARRPQFVRLMHDEGKRRGPRMRWLVDRHVKPLYERVLPFISGIQEQGLFPADLDPVHVLYCVIGAVDVIFHQAEECKRIAGFDPAEDAAVEAHLRAVEFFLTPRTPKETPA
jgi:AcrR family transcriptional regulator